MFPKTPQAIQTRIRSYENALKKEKSTFGAIDDSYGKRYLLGPLYLLLGDNAGALKSFRWFATNFPDDSGMPMHLMCWILALYKSGNLAAAKTKARQFMLSNLYLIPHLLGIEQAVLDIWHSSNLDEKAHLETIPPELFALWDEPALQWLQESYESAELTEIRQRYIAIYQQLKTEPRGPERSRLIEEAFALQYGG